MPLAGFRTVLNFSGYQPLVERGGCTHWEASLLRPVLYVSPVSATSHAALGFDGDKRAVSHPFATDPELCQREVEQTQDREAPRPRARRSSGGDSDGQRIACVNSTLNSGTA
jgi:hypothetical protein